VVARRVGEDADGTSRTMYAPRMFVWAPEVAEVFECACYRVFRELREPGELCTRTAGVFDVALRARLEEWWSGDRSRLEHCQEKDLGLSALPRIGLSTGTHYYIVIISGRLDRTATTSFVEIKESDIHVKRG